MVQEKNKDRDDDDDGMHSAREHFPVDFVNGNVAKYPQFHPPGMVSPDLMFCPMGDLVHVNHPATRASSSYATTSTTSQQAFPACPSQDDYRSFLHMSSTFSNLIMSTLLQNPAAHAAATLAASVWPYTNNVGDSSTQMSSSPPSIAAIVAATVAAATAWWASHGLLPPTPLHLPVPTPNDQLIEKQSTTFQDQNMASSSDDSEETGITKLKAEKEEVVVAAAAVVQDSQKKNPVDRSSCGLNTPSGSDAEIDALDKMEKEKEAGVTSELSNRRSKINNNNQTTDSWKEVSQGGRIAFQALFARERLPQSFSPPQVAENVNGKQSDRERSDSPFCLSPHNPKNLDLPPCSSISGDQKLL
ncbi:protein LHY-like [Brassica napus]|nr:protein LHY-like [Brassica napus]